MIRAAGLCLLLAGCATACPEPVTLIQRVPVQVLTKPQPEPRPDTALLADCARPMPAEVSARAYKLAYDAAMKSIDECNARLARARRSK